MSASECCSGLSWTCLRVLSNYSCCFDVTCLAVEPAVVAEVHRVIGILRFFPIFAPSFDDCNDSRVQLDLSMLLVFGRESMALFEHHTFLHVSQITNVHSYFRSTDIGQAFLDKESNAWIVQMAKIELDKEYKASWSAVISEINILYTMCSSISFMSIIA